MRRKYAKDLSGVDVAVTGVPFDTLTAIVFNDCAFDRGASREIPACIERHIARIIVNGTSSLVLDGDHFTTYPALTMPK